MMPRDARHHSTLTHGSTLKKLYFHFLSNWMGYDHGDSFSFDFEPNGSPFGCTDCVQIYIYIYNYYIIVILLICYYTLFNKLLL